ncbi:MAG: hypothetical protein JSS98_18315 [Bacteroidetes bacterium]|nr:hypothetical protein [Bacteroidota bacterium]
MSLIGSVSLTNKTGVYLGEVKINNFDASANNLIYTTDGQNLSGLTVGSGLTVSGNTISANVSSITGLIKNFAVTTANHPYGAGPSNDLQIVPPVNAYGLIVGNIVIIDTSFTFYCSTSGIIIHLDLHNSTGIVQSLQCSVEAMNTHLTKVATFSINATLANDTYSVNIRTDDASSTLLYDYNDYYSMQINQVQ